MRCLIGIFVLFLFLGCNSTNTPIPEEIFETEYRIPPVEGYLPWPHHNPGWSQDDVNRELVRNLFVINNFGQFQGFETDMSQNYFHSGIDVVSKNGTPIFSIEAGTVVSLSRAAPYYQTLTIESNENPEFGWAYTHVDQFDVGVGDKVEQGRFIGRINFQGLEHIHLSRVKTAPGKDWSDLSSIINLDTEPFFFYNDRVPPIIKTPFHFFANQSNNEFQSDTLSEVSGMVDIVAGIREIAPHSNDPVSGFGDRLGVYKISYNIIKDDSVLFASSSFDFSKFEITKPIRQNNPERIYKNNALFDNALDSFDKMYSYYIITNTTQSFDGNESIVPSNSWDTTEKNEAGKLKFPNGLYKIEVTASDSRGNSSIAIDSLWVKNTN